MKKPIVTLPKATDPATQFIDYTHRGETYEEASGKIAITERLGALSFDFYRTEGPVSIYVDKESQIEQLESGDWIIKINQKIGES